MWPPWIRLAAPPARRAAPAVLERKARPAALAVADRTALQAGLAAPVVLGRAPLAQPAALAVLDRTARLAVLERREPQVRLMAIPGATGATGSGADHHSGNVGLHNPWTVPVTVQNLLGALENAAFLLGASTRGDPSAFSMGTNPLAVSLLKTALVDMAKSDLLNVGSAATSNSNNVNLGSVTTHDDKAQGSAGAGVNTDPERLKNLLLPPGHHH